MHRLTAKDLRFGCGASLQSAFLTVKKPHVGQLASWLQQVSATRYLMQHHHSRINKK